MTKFKVETSTRPSQNLMLIAVFYHIIMFNGNPILLGGFKRGHEVLDMSVMGAIFWGDGADADFILDSGHEC